MSCGLSADQEPPAAVPTLTVTHAAASGGTFGFSIGNHVNGTTYAADITTRSGYHHAVFGIEPDAQGHFTLTETHFADGETSFVRIRGEGDALSAYSLAVSVSRDESVTETSDNTIRARIATPTRSTSRARNKKHQQFVATALPRR